MALLSQAAVIFSSLFFIAFLVHGAHANNRKVSTWKGHRSPISPPKRHHRVGFSPGPWINAHATFYGGADGSGTLGGACGYGEIKEQNYGLQTAAVSGALFSNGQTCGACYAIKCVNDKQWCKAGQNSIVVTATNLCPTNPQSSNQDHFDLSQPAFLQIADYKAGIIPIQYRRVPCKKKGGIRFTVTGNPYYTMVNVWNVGGAGDVTRVQVKGDKHSNWTVMRRDWGQKWVTETVLVGNSMSFRVRTSDGRSSVSRHVAPKDWQFGQTFEGKNFK